MGARGGLACCCLRNFPERNHHLRHPRVIVWGLWSHCGVVMVCIPGWGLGAKGMGLGCTPKSRAEYG